MKKSYQDDTEYMKIVEPLIQTDAVQELDNYIQHHYLSRLHHVIAVSYNSYVLAKKMHLDADAVARAGILHDLFYYDWRETTFELGAHNFIHPRLAVRNAEKITALTSLEKDIILHHMWFPGVRKVGMPQSREAFLVDFVDDWLAIKEFSGFVIHRSVFAKIIDIL